MNARYEQDAYGWANEQAALLRAGRLSEIDIQNIAEEIEGVGKAERRELVNRLTVLLSHLLKWRFQPERRGASWEGTIREQRFSSADHLADNPSLKPQMPEVIAQAYRVARIRAKTETGLDEAMFPLSCPWTAEQLFDDGFWPSASA